MTGPPGTNCGIHPTCSLGEPTCWWEGEGKDYRDGPKEAGPLAHPSKPGLLKEVRSSSWRERGCCCHKKKPKEGKSQGKDERALKSDPHSVPPGGCHGTVWCRRATRTKGVPRMPCDLLLREKGKVLSGPVFVPSSSDLPDGLTRVPGCKERLVGAVPL